MESNWRYNVWETGWANANVALVARLLVPLGVMTHIAKVYSGAQPYEARGVADAQGYVDFWAAITPAITPFPYGFQVYPDT